MLPDARYVVVVGTPHVCQHPLFATSHVLDDDVESIDCFKQAGDRGDDREGDGGD